MKLSRHTTNRLIRPPCKTLSPEDLNPQHYLRWPPVHAQQSSRSQISQRLVGRFAELVVRQPITDLPQEMKLLKRIAPTLESSTVQRPGNFNESLLSSEPVKFTHPLYHHG